MKICPTRNSLEMFLSHKMPENEQKTLEIHLADCADCRKNLAIEFALNAERNEVFETPKSLIETVKNLPESKSQNSVNKATAAFNYFNQLNKYRLAFAAGLLFCVGLIGIYLLQNRQASNSNDVLRNGAANKNDLKLLEPEDNAIVFVEKIEFRWSEMQNAKTYTLVLSDEKGDIVKEFATEKTLIETSISALGIEKEKRYFWHIRAKSADGLTSESETRKILAK